MEVRFTVDEDFIKNLQKSTGEKRVADVTKDALTLLDWAVNEVQNGRVILSSDESGSNVHRLAMPALAKAAGKG